MPPVSVPGFYKSSPHTLLLPSSKKAKQAKKDSTVFFFSYLFSVLTIRREQAMASANKASWIVPASISTVETLKDQGGLCRWKHTMRSLHQKAKNEMGSFSQARRTPSSSSSIIGGSELLNTRAEEAKRAEESFRKVMYLSSWGPN
ncbi:hypothetical protein KFK09_016025 [Dendrobium nobile]|uniref:Wound-responsive family protein n=1 Tax=Dendrobium nobile TaxID=94219 RepID=A0A8T3B7P0_DENNO|nr:hypothetical protein KFK09_016025 [Dendrobium nobile]